MQMRQRTKSYGALGNMLSSLEAMGAQWDASEPFRNRWAIRFRVTIINPIPVSQRMAVPGSGVTSSILMLVPTKFP